MMRPTKGHRVSLCICPMGQGAYVRLYPCHRCGSSHVAEGHHGLEPSRGHLTLLWGRSMF